MSAQREAEIARYLAAQEEFDRLREEALLRSGPALCDLAYANAYDGPLPEVLASLRGALDSGRTLDLQYTPFGGSKITRRLVAQRLSARCDQRFHWRDVVLTPGAMAALNLVFRSLGDEGEPAEVIVLTPCWMDYPLYLVNLGLVPRVVPATEGAHRLDLDRIRAALTPRTRALILSQPGNPTGVLYSPEELADLAKILSDQPVRPLLISDECHRDVVFAPASFVSPLAYYDRTCIVYSFGKHLLAQGQRIGYVAVSPRMDGGRSLARRLEQLCRIMGFCTPTALMQIAIRQLLDLELDLSRLAARRERAIAALSQAGYELVPSDATFFLYPRAPEPDSFSFVRRMASRGVLTLPSAMFHHAGHFRICLTASDEMLDRGLRLLEEEVAA